MEQDKKLKQRTYFWIFMLVLLAFPLFWMWQASNLSPYATAMYLDMDQQLAIDTLHPIGPNRLERFGTDPLGRNITTLLAVGMKTTLVMALIAALLRTILLSITQNSREKDTHFLQKLSFPVLFIVEFLVLRGVLLLQFFRTGDVFPKALVLGACMGLLFFSAAKRPLGKLPDRRRAFFAILLREFGWVLLIIALLGLTGATLGENTYANIPALTTSIAYSTPELMTMIASVFSYGITMPWTWGIPLIAVVWLGIICLSLAEESFKRLRARGRLLPKALSALAEFFNPLIAIPELINFSHYALQNLTRFAILGIIFVMVYLGRPENSTVYKTLPAVSYADTLQATETLTDADARFNHIETLFTDNQMHPRESGYRYDIDGQRLMAASILGLSRTRPIAYVFDINSDPETFALQTAFVEGLIKGWRAGGLQQSFFIAFSEGDHHRQEYMPIMQSMYLTSPSLANYVSMSNMRGDKMHVDETMLFTVSTLSGDVSNDLRKGLDTFNEVYTIGYNSPMDPVAKAMKTEGFAGISLTTEGEATPEQMQEHLDALLTGSLFYAVRRYR